MSESEEQKPLFVYRKKDDGRIERVELGNFIHGGWVLLWFNPEVIEALLTELGMKLEVNEQNLLEISSPNSFITFSVNNFGLIAQLAVDIARLPYEEQCVWVKHNCKPKEEYPEEAERRETEGRNLSSSPVESIFCHALDEIDSAFHNKFGLALLGEYNEEKPLIEKIHRFQVTDEKKLQQLAKNIVKVSIERMDRQALIDALNKEESESGTLGLLRELLARNRDDTYAYERMKPLFGLWDLATADNRLSSSDIQSCYTLLDINGDGLHIFQASNLLQSVADALGDISEELNRNIKDE